MNDKLYGFDDRRFCCLFYVIITLYLKNITKENCPWMYNLVSVVV
jgi:hypothetical protein